MDIPRGCYYREETLVSNFHAVRNAVFDSGGDGWGCILSPDFEMYADLFEDFEKSLPEPFFIKRDQFVDEAGRLYISFEAFQESIAFTEWIPEHQVDSEDIIVRLRPKLG